MICHILKLKLCYSYNFVSILVKMTYTQEDLSKIAKHILEHATSRIFLFYGSMGVGKTTLIKEICYQLGAREIASSPSFSIVNEYEIPDGLIYHFDFYRIDNPQEAMDLGVEDYLYSGHFVFIEWPDKISELLPKEIFNINISKNEDQSRTLSFN